MAGPGDAGFLGRGWASPPRAGATSEVALVAGEDDVHDAVRLIIGTNHGERAMRPTYGGNLRALAFEPLDSTTMALARHQVEEALVVWEPRIDVESVRVSAADGERSLLLIEVAYRVRATNTFYNLVYPFYLSEGADA